MTQEMPERPPAMRCPFPPCAANLRPMIHRLDPYDVTKTETVYPIHQVEGEGSWYGRCPASQLIVPKLSDRGRELLADSLGWYERRRGERARLATMLAAVARARAELDPLLPPNLRKGVQPPNQMPHGMSNVVDLHTGRPLGDDDETPLGVPQGLRRPYPGDSVEHYFPGRPGDPVEPGTGDEPAAPLPATAGGEPLGRAGEMSSSRAETKGQLAAAAQAATEIQAGAAIAFERLDAIDAVISGMADNQQIAGAMMVAAIGTDGTAPQVAIEALAAASRVGELINEMREAAAMLRMRTEGANRVAGRIHHGATEYSNTF